MKTRIKKGDTVMVLAGKSRGAKAKVLRILPARPNGRSGGPAVGRAVVDGVNLVKRRERSRQSGKPGQVVTRPAPIQLSNLAIFCAGCGRGVRVGAKMEGKNKMRICRRCGKTI